MTTRAQLESEREALVLLLKHTDLQVGFGYRCMVGRREALTASIARVDALLSLSDEQCAYLVGHEEELARHDAVDAAFDDSASEGCVRPSDSAVAHQTVAEIVRRS